jgi:predicted RNA methylase
VRLGHGIVIPAPAPLASMKMPSRKIPDDVMDVLRETRREGPRVFLPGQLERKLYEKTAEVLESIGAKWKRGSKKEPGAHVFADPERQVEFENLVSAGAYTTDSDLAYFATPSDLAERIVGMAGPLAGKNVLEPSAGEGAIVYWLLRSGARVTAVEFEPRRAKALESRYPNITTIVGDFLAIPAPVPPSFDAVVMNPPFSLPGRRHADIDHALHATRFLKSGGTMVADAGVDVNRPRCAGAERSSTPSVMDGARGRFKESGTLVPTVTRHLLAAHAAPSPKRLTEGEGSL